MPKLRNIINMVLTCEIDQLSDILKNVHPVDFLEQIEIQTPPLSTVLARLPDFYVVLLIEEAEDEDKYRFLSHLSEERKEVILSEMSSDELVDLIESVDDVIKERIIQRLDDPDELEVRQLMGYGPETAGGLMATEFIAIHDQMTVSQTIDFLRKEAPDSETPYYLFVLDQEAILRGVVSLRDIITSSADQLIQDIMMDHVTSVPFDMEQEEIGNVFEKYGYMVMPVVDPNNHMLGIITADDVMEVISEEHTKDMYRMAGLDDEEDVDNPVSDSVKSRLPWLFINMFTASIAASMVSLFEGTISKIVALATFMPIIAGMGGNAGAQSLTLMIRSIALGELTFENAKKVFYKELAIGLINGMILGIVMGTMGYLIEGNIWFGVVIGLALFMNFLVATSAGFFVPYTLKKLKIDPALASSIFVTAMTDTLGFFFFLGLATIFMQRLL